VEKIPNFIAQSNFPKSKSQREYIANIIQKWELATEYSMKDAKIVANIEMFSC